MNRLATAHGELQLPTFLPDGTRAVVKCLDAHDVRACGVDCLMINTLHLSSAPGTSLVKALGGAHAFMGWDGIIASDSGGFQALSMTGGGGQASVTAEGIVYRDKHRGPTTLSPEKCIQKQLQLGADILFCLDHCARADATPGELDEAVANTIAWSRRCKEEFVRKTESFGADRARPLLFAVVQGGNDLNRRRRCAEALVDIGFDGFGFGGWPIDSSGTLVDEVYRTAELLPPDLPLHGLGIGKPEGIVAAFRAGYHMFDCVLPTRDARHSRFYRFEEGWADGNLDARDYYNCINIGTERFARDRRPIEEGCDCLCCRRYSLAYLHHLFECNEPAGQRLATIHNLRFYTRLMERLRKECA